MNESLFSAFELESFKEGLKALEEFRNYEDYLSGLESFYREVETLYLDIQREYATANMWARREVFALFFFKKEKLRGFIENNEFV